MKLNFENSLINLKEVENIKYKLQSEINKMKSAIQLGYDDDRASINLPEDIQMLKQVQKIINDKKKLNPKYLIVIGIGGSNLGTIAVQEAILGKLYNQLNPDIKILYADTVDSDLISSIIKIIKPVLERGENIIINGISKSGSTTETIANFEVLVEIIKDYNKQYEKYIVITTDKDSKFWNYAINNGIDILEIPKKVGGRFSVFSPVGLFPLGLIGIDINILLESAKLMRDRCLETDIMSNPAALSSALIYLHKLTGRNIHDLFLFSVDFESIGKWYRQLMGESIGKEYNYEHEKVFEGITPTVSIGSTDLHSMAQMYLGGPYDKLTTFVGIENVNSEILIPDKIEYNELVEEIQKLSINEVMDAIYKGVKVAFKKGSRPFLEILLHDKSESSIGQFLQFKMMEIMYLGFLLNVNPFNQPNVESYKIETRNILNNINKHVET